MEENAGGSGHEGSFKVKNIPLVFLVARVTLSSAINPIFSKSQRSRTVTIICIGWALGEVLDDETYATGLGVSPERMCSLLEGLKISPQSSDHLELAVEELLGAACFGGRAINSPSSAYIRWFTVRLSARSST